MSCRVDNNDKRATDNGPVFIQSVSNRRLQTHHDSQTWNDFRSKLILEVELETSTGVIYIRNALATVIPQLPLKSNIIQYVKVLWSKRIWFPKDITDV